MQALQLHAFGDPGDAVGLVEAPTPRPGRGEALVAVGAAPINPSDLHLIGGYYGVRPELPAPLGTEGVGRVLGVGAGVHEELAGRRVVIVPGHQHGTWATHAVIAVENLVVADEKADLLQLAMAGVNPVTALLLLGRYATLHSGDWIAQTGANSAVGEYVARLAKLAGVKTFNVVRRETAAEQVQALGGDVVVLDDEHLPARLRSALGDRELSLVIDSVGGPSVAVLAHRLQFGGKVVSYGAISGAPTALSVRDDIVYRQISHHGFWIVNWLRNASREEIRSTYEAVVGQIARGQLLAAVERTYGLAEHRDALARAGRYRRQGKVLFVPDGADPGP